MQPGIGLEFLEQAKHVGDGEFAAPPVNELYGLTALQIDAGDQHGRRTSICLAARSKPSWWSEPPAPLSRARPPLRRSVSDFFA